MSWMKGNNRSHVLCMYILVSLPFSAAFSWGGLARRAFSMRRVAAAKTRTTTTATSRNTSLLMLSEKNETDRRRWDALMTYCLGNWSGGIGWYDKHERPTGRNMRMSFTRRLEDHNLADWRVYNAHFEGSKDHVVLEKYRKPEKEAANPVTFYCFDEGIIGRTGTNLSSSSNVEHGFWADDIRRTAVLTYNTTTGEMKRITYIQQEKQQDEDFDLQASNPDHVSILPNDANDPARALNEGEQTKLFKEWSTAKMQRSERFDGTHQPCDDDEGALLRLLGHNDEMLRMKLPNGVILACPWSLRDASDAFFVSFGFQRPCGQIQILELNYAKGIFQWAQASWYKNE